MNTSGDDTPGNGHDREEEPGGARALTLHVLRMFATRAEAAGLVVASEVQWFKRRIQLNLLAGGAVVFAIWSGIVLLAIALPEHLRVPVLAGVVAAFAIGAVAAWFAGKRKIEDTVGSLRWFLEGLRLDLEVLDRVLEGSRGQRQSHAPSMSPSPEQPTPPPAAGPRPDPDPHREAAR